MILNQLKSYLLPAVMLVASGAFAQQAHSGQGGPGNGGGPQVGCTMNITCPPNVVAYTAPNNCLVPVTYTDPVTTGGCGAGGSVTFNYTGSIQTFTVPANSTLLYITAMGAQGGSVSTTCAATGGLGAYITGEFVPNPGEVLSILVGGQGLTNGSDAGGGGGSFVVRAGNIPLVVAGGGGGATNNITSCGANRNGLDATAVTSGTASANGLVAGGTNGNGGGASTGSGGGGGGFYTDGVAGQGLANNNGKSYINGGAGGTGNNNDSGGYGGGGAGWFTGGNGGGGGGYSGGGTSGSQPFTGGGGGGSYNAGANQTNIPGTHPGNGQVVIDYIQPSPAYSILTQGLPNGSNFPLGVTIQHYLGTDSASAADDSCTFTVTVLDTVRPTLVCPSNIVVNHDPGFCGAVVSFNTPIGSDACTPVTTTLIAGLPSGSTFPAGATNVTLEAEDGSANLTTCTFTVTVLNDSSTQSLTVCDGESVTVGNNTYSTSGTYVDVLTSVNGCDSVVSTILIVKAPINTATTTNGPVISAQQNAATYQWLDCGNGNAPIPGETNQSFTPAQSGSYAVIVTVSGCSDTSSCELVVGVEKGHTSPYSLSPNPTSGRVNVVFGSVIESATIEVFDLAGKRLLVRTESNVSRSQLDFSNFENGTYFVKVITANGQDVMRVVKQD